MKVKTVMIIIAVIVLIVGGIVTYLISMMGREARSGLRENGIKADVSLIEEQQDIVYIGDSLTAGFNSDGKMTTENRGYRSVIEDKLVAEDKLGTTYNYAVGGYLIDDIIEQFENDATVSEANASMRGKNFSKELEAMYPTTLSDDPTISEAIKKSDSVIITVGANDVLTSITFDEQTQKMDIDMDILFSTLKSVQDKKENLFKQIKEINPDVKIYDVGIYMAYSYIDEKVMNRLYPLLAYGERKIFVNKPGEGIYKVKIRDNMQAELKKFVDNPNDIHPNYLGYEVMGNEILKTMIKNQ